MIPRQTWPSFPVTLPQQGMVGAWPEYPAMVLPLQTLPYVYIAGVEDQRHNRRVLLTRSVFHLVYDSMYLDLTDPKLLAWYLSLSPEDRSIIQDEGGLHSFLKNHPFLEMSRRYIYVKNDIRTNQPHGTCIMHKSEVPGSKECTCEETDLTNIASENLPHNVMENLTLGDGSNNSVYNQQDSFFSAHSSPVTLKADHQRAPQLGEPLWQMANSSSGAVSKDPGSLENFSLDMELKRYKSSNPKRTPVMQVQSTRITDTGISPLMSEQSAIRPELPSECCNLGDIHLDDTECDKSIFEIMKCGEETISSLDEDPDSLHSIMHDDKSIILLVAPNNPQPNIRRGHSDEDPSESGTPATCKTDQPLIQKTTAEKYTSPMPCAPTCDVMVGTEQAICSSAFAQTQNPATADKHLTTELHMSDLDYLAEEFIKLKTEREELQKGKMKCSGCKLRKKCDNVQRAQQAELSLLDLQYRLCRQHCLKVRNTFAKEDQPLSVQKDHHCPKSPPVNIESVLKKLECDYNQMRENIQAGIPLHHLKPLSVDCAQVTGAYVPAQITGDELGDSASRSSQQPQNNTSTEEPQCPRVESSKDCQGRQIYMNQLQEGMSKTSGAATLIPNERDTGHNTHKPEESQSATAFKDLSTSEVWYDAEEDLRSAVAAETEQNTMTSKHLIDEYETGEEKMSSMLCVSDLPSDVTEVLTQLSLTSSRKQRKVVNIPPMAEGTCLSQHCNIMGSFEILMAELRRRHPDVGKQQIVDALLELWVKHQGVLSGMTLKSIIQMTSEILTRPESTTQL